MLPAPAQQAPQSQLPEQQTALLAQVAPIPLQQVPMRRSPTCWQTPEQHSSSPMQVLLLALQQREF
jgi:hypothetical protein